MPADWERWFMAVLAEIDFSRPADVAELVRRQPEEHLPGTERGFDEPTEMIERFLASPRAAEIAASRQVHRELEFLLAWPPEGHYLQGFIDCLYCDTAGQWRLVDYKSNRATADTLAAVAGRTRCRCSCTRWRRADSEVSAGRVGALFLRPGLEHRFAWDAAARDRVAALVDGALR